MGRRTLFLFIGLLVILGAIYLSSGRFSADKNSLSQTVKSNKNTAITSGQVLGAETVRSVLGGVDSLIAQTEQTIKKGAANLVQSVSQSATNQITSAILGSSTPSAPQVQPVQQTSTGASICPSYPKNQIVAYILKFASSSANQAYSVDWGDGHKSEGTTGSSEISFSHTYSNSGSFTATFKAGSFTSQKDICVQ